MAKGKKGEKMKEKNGKVCIYACFGGFSNTGIATAIASMEAIKEVGLDKACIGCLAGIPNDVESVKKKNDIAEKIIAIDGCQMGCARKILEKAGYEPASIVLARDIGMEKKSLYEIADGSNLTDHVDRKEIEKAKKLIMNKIMEE